MAKMASEDAALREIPEEYILGFQKGIAHTVSLLRSLAVDFRLIEGDDSHEAAYHDHLADVLEKDHPWE